MSIKSKICSLAIMAATIGFGQAAHAQFATTLKVSGVSRAVQATHAPGDEERLFIVMRSGYIKIYNLETETLNSDYFLNIASQVYDNQNEQGLLGLAFHPEYQDNGYFYVYYCVDRHHLLYYGTPNYDPRANWYTAATIGRLTRYTAEETRKLRGHQSDEIEKVLGYKGRASLVHRDDMVV